MGIFASKKEIGPDTVLKRNQDILFNQVDGEVVMLSIENGEYYGMDKVGSQIWKILEFKTSLKDLLANLMKEFNVSEEKCRADTLAFLQKMLNKKLIVIV